MNIKILKEFVDGRTRYMQDSIVEVDEVFGREAIEVKLAEQFFTREDYRREALKQGKVTEPISAEDFAKMLKPVKVNKKVNPVKENK